MRFGDGAHFYENNLDRNELQRLRQVCNNVTKNLLKANTDNDIDNDRIYKDRKQKTGWDNISFIQE